MALAEVTIPEWTMGERFAKARKHAGLNQEQMAARLNVSASTLAAWESDRNQPRDLPGVAQQWSDGAERASGRGPAAGVLPRNAKMPPASRPGATGLVGRRAGQVITGTPPTGRCVPRSACGRSPQAGRR